MTVSDWGRREREKFIVKIVGVLHAADQQRLNERLQIWLELKK
jgi:hypothetical protein